MTRSLSSPSPLREAAALLVLLPVSAAAAFAAGYGLINLAAFLLYPRLMGKAASRADR